MLLDFDEVNKNMKTKDILMDFQFNPMNKDVKKINLSLGSEVVESIWKAETSKSYQDNKEALDLINAWYRFAVKHGAPDGCKHTKDKVKVAKMFTNTLCTF